MSNTNTLFPSAYLNQHLVNPENCVRCASCERVCKAGAISHDTNFVIDPDKCNACLDCLSECPTGAIDNWRIIAREHLYSLPEQHAWKELPPPSSIPAALVDPSWSAARSPRERSSSAPASSPSPCLNLFPPQQPAMATVCSNCRITSTDSSTDIHKVVLDFGTTSFPWTEGQTLGILPPGTDTSGKPHPLRLYSISSPRDGETPNRPDVALTVKRIVEDRHGKPVIGTSSNFLCDLQIGMPVQVTGPYGGSFLMPDDPAARLLMIATGTGISPIRAMILRRQRAGTLNAKNSVLIYGGRTPEEMPYYDELATLASDQLTLYPAHSRSPVFPKRYVQNVLIEQRLAVVEMLRDPNCYLYLCGLRNMEQDVMQFLHRIGMAAHLDWPALREQLHREGRLHVETY
ncbi:4Fe-4S binding protein [Ferribacterium limneticum]|uniref:4Fe-4S binding protein n=1 Tax=Ferribacterium limneticum TaxID=76259 RepID=UPI001CF83A61|nr:4Fe-4S binding protein [Ferribacterium limneticum]UCV23642.1 4Fe-4S binding protein [Ferribacterium limneticum]